MMLRRRCSASTTPLTPPCVPTSPMWQVTKKLRRFSCISQILSLISLFVQQKALSVEANIYELRREIFYAKNVTACDYALECVCRSYTTHTSPPDTTPTSFVCSSTQFVTCQSKTMTTLHCGCIFPRTECYCCRKIYSVRFFKRFFITLR